MLFIKSLDSRLLTLLILHLLVVVFLSVKIFLLFVGAAIRVLKFAVLLRLISLVILKKLVFDRGGVFYRKAQRQALFANISTANVFLRVRRTIFPSALLHKRIVVLA